MSWSLSASGHALTLDGVENSAEIERELHDKLAEVLSDPHYGANFSAFHGMHVTGQPHVRSEVPADQETVEDDGPESNAGA